MSTYMHIQHHTMAKISSLTKGEHSRLKVIWTDTISLFTLFRGQDTGFFVVKSSWFLSWSELLAYKVIQISLNWFLSIPIRWSTPVKHPSITVNVGADTCALTNYLRWKQEVYTLTRFEWYVLWWVKIVLLGWAWASPTLAWLHCACACMHNMLVCLDRLLTINHLQLLLCAVTSYIKFKNHPLVEDMKLPRLFGYEVSSLMAMTRMEITNGPIQWLER